MPRKKSEIKEIVDTNTRDIQTLSISIDGLSTRVDRMSQELIEFKDVVTKKLNELENMIIRETTITINNGDGTPKEIVDKNKFFEDLYKRTRYNFIFQSLFKILGPLLTILLILNLIITIMEKFK